MINRRLVALAAGAVLLLAACGSSDVAPAVAVSQTSSSAPVAAEPQSTTTTVAQPAPDVVESAASEVGAEAGLVAVSAADVEAALSGNTIVGNWLGEDYRQFFDPDGNTFYLPDGGSQSQGQWRVNIVTEQYESLWGPARIWDTYDVFRDGDEWFWNGSGVELSGFTIVNGDQLAANS